MLKVCREMVTKLTYARCEAEYQELYTTFQEAAPQQVCVLYYCCWAIPYWRSHNTKNGGQKINLVETVKVLLLIYFLKATVFTIPL